MRRTIRAGAAVVEITPGAGVSMGGYGARVGTATGIHDPLHVRTVVLDDGDTSLVIAVCDVVGVPTAMVRQARELIAAECGIPAAHVCISATHTHSGPLLSSGDVRDYLGVTARKIAGSVQIARRRMQPVLLKLATANVTTISQNRRDPEGPIEQTAQILLVAPPGGAEPVATIINYACHATVLEHDNLLYSADFPGAMARAVERAVGGVGVYIQGAAGNINPVWMRHDFAEVERIGGILGAAAARAVHELRPLGEGQWAVNLSWSERSPAPPARGTVLTDVRFAARQRFLEIERRHLQPLGDISHEIERLERDLAKLRDDDVSARRGLLQRLNALRMDRLQATTDATKPGTTERVEMQAFRLSDECALLALPGEFFVELAREIESAGDVRHLLINGYANASIGYVPTRQAFALGGYEAGRARFVEDADRAFVQTATELVRALYAEEGA